ncbi:MAG: formyltetrahydrofolate deformylase [Myxococcales bacterium]|nr:MAG: formyltetrahydrofolate deformylase [Myxococcales bacterium]
MQKGTTATLLISCADQPGLVAAVSEFVFKHGGSILSADQHTDQREGMFLQRVEWGLGGFALDRGAIAHEFSKVASRFGMQWKLRFSDQRLKVAVLVSKQSHCLYDLLARWRAGELHADIKIVLSNHPDLANVARCFGLPFEHYPVDAENKAAQEQKLLDVLNAHQIDLVVLARYMQILSDDFVARFPKRIINIHHSFLPAFAGAKPYHRAHARGVKLIGATAHYVTADLDEGPIIAQDVTRITHRDAVDDLIAKGKDLEKIVLSRAVGWHLGARVIVYGNRTVVFA